MQICLWIALSGWSLKRETITVISVLAKCFIYTRVQEKRNREKHSLNALSKKKKKLTKVFSKHNPFFQRLRRPDSLSSARCRRWSQAASPPSSSCSYIPRRHLADIFSF